MNHKVTTRSYLPDYVANIIVHVLLLYVVSRLTTWLPFIDDGFSAVAWLLYISYSLTIAANIFYIFYDDHLLKALVQLALNLFSIVIFYTLLKVFPFNLEPAAKDTARIIIYVILFGVSVGAFAEFIKILKIISNRVKDVHE